MSRHAVNDVLHITALHRAQNLRSFPVIKVGFRLTIFFVSVSILGFRLKTLLECFESLSIFLSCLFQTFRSISISLLIGEPGLVDMPDGPRPQRVLPPGCGESLLFLLSWRLRTMLPLTRGDPSQSILG